jgi:putative glutamine amidotransferase
MTAAMSGSLAGGCVLDPRRSTGVEGTGDSKKGNVMRPVIGVTCDLQVDNKKHERAVLRSTYARAIERAGGAIVVLPLGNEMICGDVLQDLDGLILSGGGDIPEGILRGERPPEPLSLMARRYRSDRCWLETALRLNKPVLGICLGAQIMNVAAGGSLVIDIATEIPNAFNHREGHEIRIEPDSKLAAWAPAHVVKVTSYHHQSVRDLGAGYRVAAASGDGVIEAIESTTHEFLIGAQWHPERNVAQPDWLLQALVRQCTVASGAAIP